MDTLGKLVYGDIVTKNFLHNQERFLFLRYTTDHQEDDDNYCRLVDKHRNTSVSEKESNLTVISHLNVECLDPNQDHSEKDE